MKRILPELLIASAILVGPVAAWAQDSISSLPLQAKERAALFPTPNSVAQGKALAEAACADCHGHDGISADERRPHLAGQRTIYLYREMLAYQEGTRSNEDMRNAVAFLNPDALLKTAIYYASLSPPFDREAAAEQTSILMKLDDDPLLAVKAATAGCGSCHGANGNSTIPGIPSLTSQHPDYFVASMKAYQSGERTDNMMQTLVAALDDEAVRDMGLYYALQAPLQTAQAGPGDARAGQALAESCAGCHGADGNTKAADTPSLAGQDPVYFVKAMKAYLNGQRTHAPMESAVTGLGDPEFNDLAAFYSAQKPVARQVRKPLTAAEWSERCDRCHGAGGNSTDPRYSRLAGQNRQYLEDVLHDYADGERSDSIMHAMTQPLNHGVIERLATFYAAQESRSVVYLELPCDDREHE